jgi:phosphoribosylaminoimidazole (AIR) synthetase
MALIVPVEDVDDILERLQGLGEQAYLIGAIGKLDDGAEPVVFGPLAND